jgi:predicted aldo/keto reductase-like oxidoreductase
MFDISRRQFLARAPLAAGAVMLGSRWAAAEAAPSKPKSGTDLVTLGSTGIKMSLMGIGTGTHGVGRSSNQMKLGAAGFIKLVRHAVDRGITYFDVADQYGSHLYLREALQGVDRDRLFIQTKTRALHPEVAKVDVERFRQELGVDTIDSLLMHCMNAGTWPADMRPVMDVMYEAKEKKQVRAVGISCHTLEALGQSAGCDWLDVQLARINPFGSAMDGPPEQVVPRLKELRAAGKGVIGMKICGGGRNTGPEERLQSLRFVLESGCVDAMTIGCESVEQIDENLALIEKVLA